MRCGIDQAPAPRTPAPGSGPGRTMSVVAPVSSSDTNEARSIERCQTRHRRRCSATSGRSCPAALELFLVRRPSRRRVDQIVVRGPGVMPRPRSASLTSAGLTPFRAVVGWCSDVPCPESSGLRQPPIVAGVPPVSRTRRTSSIAADAPTSSRAAASRAEPRSSTARTNRLRKPRNKGAVTTASLLNRHARTRTADPSQPRPALASVRP